MPDEIPIEDTDIVDSVAQKAEFANKVREENTFPDKVVIHEGTKFVVSSEVKAMSQEEVEENLGYAKLNLAEFLRLTDLEKLKLTEKVQNWEIKLTQFE